MIISVNAENAFDKIQHSFIIKRFNKPRMYRNSINMLKSIYEKPIYEHHSQGEKWKAFPLITARR